MARLLTCGFESGAKEEYSSQLGAAASTSAQYAVDTGTVRSGTYSLKFDSGASNVASALTLTAAAATGSYYFKAYVNIPAAPGNRCPIVGIGTTHSSTPGAGEAVLTINTDASIAFWFGGSQIGTTAALATSAWHKIELQVSWSTTAGVAETAEGRVNGVSLGTGNSDILSANQQLAFGWLTTPGANSVFYIDDIAINDTTGTSETSWPTSDKIVALLPVADSAVGTGWTLGTGTAIASNGFGSVDNRPPVGVADLAAGSDPKQIRNATSNANSAYDAQVTDYTTAGLIGTDTINVVHPVVLTAAAASTSPKSATLQVVSNPAGTASASFSVYQGTFAAGTYPTGWKWTQAAPVYAPSVTLGTKPVLRANQVTASTRIAMVCFMCVCVDYSPAAAAPTIKPKPLIVMQAVNRAASW